MSSALARSSVLFVRRMAAVRARRGVLEIESDVEADDDDEVADTVGEGASLVMAAASVLAVSSPSQEPNIASMCEGARWYAARTAGSGECENRSASGERVRVARE